MNEDAPQSFDALTADSLLKEVLEKFKNHNFKQSKKIDTGSEELEMSLYEVDYYKERLNVIEHFEEGEITLANRLSIKRDYIPIPTHPDPTMYAYHTVMEDTTIEKKGTIGMVHGFAQTHDMFIEGAI